MLEHDNRMNKTKFYMDLGEMIFSKFFTIDYTDICIELANDEDAIQNAAEFLHSIMYTFKHLNFLNDVGIDVPEKLVTQVHKKFGLYQDHNGEHEHLYVYFTSDLKDKYHGHYRPIYRIRTANSTDTIEVMLTTQLCDQSCMAEFVVYSKKITEYMKCVGLAHVNGSEYIDSDVFLLNAQNTVYANETYQKMIQEREAFQLKIDTYRMMNSKPITPIKS